MAEEKGKRIQHKDIVGLKYFDQLGELLQQLHDVGCERDRAGNRLLHMDQSCMLILLYMFNPVLAEQDFAACRDLCAREPKFSADLLAPVAHKVRLAAKVLSGRKDLP